MKKTLKTAMTSAMFAAALGVSAGTISVGDNVAQSVDTAEDPMYTTTTMSEPQGLYGPPPATETTTEIYETETTTFPTALYGPPPTTETSTETTVPELETSVTETETTFVSTTTTTVPPPLYGPPPVEYFCDLNGDQLIDARDLTLFKRAILEDKAGNVYHDLNHDGVVNEEDVKVLRRLITGKSEEEERAEEEAKQTTTATTTTAPLLTTTMTTTVPEPLYGPPPMFD